MKSLFRFFTKPFFTYGIFWSWNIILMVLLIFVQVETGFLTNIIHDAFIGRAPWDHTLYVLLIFAIPILCIVLGFTKLRKQPIQLLRLFYGVELPLVFLMIARLVMFREMTPATLLIFLAMALGMFSYLIELIGGKLNTTRSVQVFKTFGHTFLFGMGVYFFSILLFYCIPMASFMIQGFFEFEWLEIFTAGFWIFLGAFFFLATATLFVVLPIALLVLYFQSSSRLFKSAELPYTKVIMSSVFVLTFLTIGLLSSNQPHHKAFRFFDKEDFTVADKIYFYENSEELKNGLVHAYLAKYRYISTQESSNSVAELYEEAFPISYETAQGIQDAFNVLMTPFLFQGNFHHDKAKAEDLYAEYFDASIQKAESKKVIKALEATWDRDGVEAGVLNVNQEKVLIKKQEITLKADGDLAQIEVHEVYQNQTFSQQEIFYYFSLPPNSVVTGMWLSDSDSIDKKYSFHVSPRGAAQEVYKREVRRRVDPSLLEMVGTNQFRLRAFPIEPKTQDWAARIDRGTAPVIPGKNFHLWFSYTTLANQNGEWLMPQLLEKRNVYWDDDTELLINGESVKREKNKWLQELPEKKKGIKRETHFGLLNDSVIISCEAQEIQFETSVQNRNITVLIDASQSMKAHEEQLLKTMEQIKKKGFKEVKIVLATKTPTLLALDEFDEKYLSTNQPFFGSSTMMEMLGNAKNHLNNTDLVLLITDQGNYEAADDSLLAFPLKAPLYFLHLDQQPPIYQDALLEMLQNSQGTVVHNVDDVLTQYSFTHYQKENPETLTYSDGRLYKIAQNDELVESSFNPIAAAKYIGQQKLGDTNRLANLDFLHRMAFTNKIVTQFSSMIVLVNQRQLDALKEAEQREDRFDREVEDGTENTSTPSDLFNVSGTPEPHEWLLLLVVFGFMVYHMYGKYMLKNRAE